ncbi:biotin-dependent carboxyltransferase family protein [Nicoliella spurrieriana]|uniref:Biotin-dependent carboxyltransferase family protein n=1 Tax=Nicoliella spurrieriana TaxID=2925830 RepID=A0A976RRU4_9LACO|nr:biotin-dependent carboxyltransferase family protein [Nicoliella spurrieriana]UQS86590.1 biotin-dependent carboxyltransferase family protein [Nicoliella spurrieriana]
MDKLLVIDAGLQTTIQDLGRFNHQIDGFPTSGCMDQFACKIANLLVGNAVDAAVLEVCITGGTFQFESETFIAFTGGDFALTLNGKSINPNRAIMVQRSDILKIGYANSGRYGYLAIAGGILIPVVMDSRSTTTRIGIGGLHGRSLQAGDCIPISSNNTLDEFAFRQSPLKSPVSVNNYITIRFVKGPQWEQFEQADVKTFLGQSYQVSSAADRMGYRLIGKPIKTSAANMLSEATVFGGIQISSDGKPIVLLADRQTTGGYPVIGVIISVDIPKFVQSQTNRLIKFDLVSFEDANDELLKQQTAINNLNHSWYLKRFKAPIGIKRSAAQKISTLFEQE